MKCRILKRNNHFVLILVNHPIDILFIHLYKTMVNKPIKLNKHYQKSLLEIYKDTHQERPTKYS